ncbi:MAG TPA: nucleotidyltransferase family protein [Nevskiaceae bacterium]|nr:nucleotidyltransferase family protein [Nevskiaceae bacterium]
MRPPAVVLAGGLGTRLASVVRDVPKPMAPVNGRPFLEYLLAHLEGQGVRQVVLAVGHLREVIIRHFGDRFRGLALSYSVESEPLGTGGAIRQAFEQAGFARAFVLNGDTHCPVDLAALQACHEAQAAELTLTLTEVADSDRFGAVSLDDQGWVRAFREKQASRGPGLINAGVYLMERRLLERAPAQPRFSFETELMQASVGQAAIAGHISPASFIDIGIPSEFARAQTLFHLT